MIRAGATDRRTGQKTVILGLSDINLQRLVAGDPIVLNLAEDMAIDVQLVLLHGPTDQDIADQFVKLGAIPPEAARSHRWVDPTYDKVKGQWEEGRRISIEEQLEPDWKPADG